MRFVLIAVCLLVSSLSFAEENHSFSPSLVLGGGVDTVRAKRPLYLDAKVFLFKAETTKGSGLVLLGAGTVFHHDDFDPIFSPGGLYCDHVNISIDIGPHTTGFSFGYQIDF